MNELILPVSVGEAIDKLTILHIKLDKIKDNRKVEVQKEYDVLKIKLSQYIKKYDFYYNMLKKTNLDIWNMLEDITQNKHNNTKLKYEIMLHKNDIRFKIKDRINTIANSILKEKKGYYKNTIVINISDKLDFNLFIEPLKYYTFLFDKVIVNINKKVVFDNEFPVYFNKDCNDIKIDKILNFMNDKFTIKEIYELFDITEEITDTYKNILFF